MNSTTETSAASVARAALAKTRDDLIKAIGNATSATNALRDAIVAVRPSGVLTVDEMADAIGRDRNYVDSIWSAYGDTVEGKQTRAATEASDEARAADVDRLVTAAGAQRAAAGHVNVMRDARDSTVAEIYAGKVLGPSAIAAAVGIDRNHVLRIARKRNVAPVWRVAGVARNQHTADKPATTDR